MRRIGIVNPITGPSGKCLWKGFQLTGERQDIPTARDCFGAGPTQLETTGCHRPKAGRPRRKFTDRKQAAKNPPNSTKQDCLWPTTAAMRLHCAFSVSLPTQSVRKHKPRLHARPREGTDLTVVVSCLTRNELRHTEDTEEHLPLPPATLEPSLCSTLSRLGPSLLPGRRSSNFNIKQHPLHIPSPQNASPAVPAQKAIHPSSSPLPRSNHCLWVIAQI